MKMTQMVGRRLKEVPKDAKTASHQFLIRGGYIRPVSTGIYSLLPAGKKIVERIEAIIREEMNKIDGQAIRRLSLRIQRRLLASTKSSLRKSKRKPRKQARHMPNLRKR